MNRPPRMQTCTGILVFTLLSTSGVMRLTLSQNPSMPIWPMYQADARHTGFIPTQPLTGKPSPLWQYRVCNQYLYEPRIMGNFVYVLTGSGTLFRIDMVTGQRENLVNLGTYSSGQMDITDKGLIYRFYHVGRQEMTLRLERLPQRVIVWQQLLDPQRWPLENPFLARALSDGQVLIYGGRSQQIGLIRVTENGPFWIEPPERNEDVTYFPEIFQDRIFMIVQKKYLKAWRIGSGRYEWSINLPSESSAAPTISGNRICVPLVNRSLSCFSLDKGELLNEHPYSDDVFNVPFPYVQGKLLAVTQQGKLLEFLLDKGSTIEWVKTGLAPSTSVVGNAHEVWFGAVDGSLIWVDTRDHRTFAHRFKSAPRTLIGLEDGVLVAGQDFIARVVSTVKKPIDVAWTINLDCPITGGFVLDESRVYMPGASNSLLSLERDTGRLVWERQVGDKIANPPLVIGDYVIVQTRGYQTLALRRSDGQRIWETSSLSGFNFAPIYADTILFIDRPGSIVGISWPDRTQIWASGKEAGMDVRGWSLFSSPAVEGSSIVYVTNRDNISAWNWKESKLLWSQNAPTRVTAPPVIMNGRVFIGLGSGVFRAYELANGRQVFEHTIGEPLLFPSSAVDGTVYLPVPSGIIEALDAKTGKVLWRHQTHRKLTTALSVTLKDVIGGAENLIFALDRKTGKVRWELAVDYVPEYTPVLAGKNLFVVGRDGYLHVYSGVLLRSP